ncbi:MAG: (2Fe-2S)-binding protein, partial [Anaerovoracaceae bacterium]
EDIDDKEDKSVTAEGLASVIAKEAEFFDSIPLDKVITQFTGLRAHGDTGDFVIESPQKGFINCAAIESPGLSASPAIAEMVEKILLEAGAAGKIKADYQPEVKGIVRFKNMTTEEKNDLIAKNPSYGRVVCRCEEITEGEILDAIHRNPPARDIDGVKRRTRAGMGRCQGGFCMPSVAELLSEELKIPFEKVTKSGKGSEITFERTKTGGEK